MTIMEHNHTKGTEDYMNTIHDAISVGKPCKQISPALIYLYVYMYIYMYMYIYIYISIYVHMDI